MTLTAWHTIFLVKNFSMENLNFMSNGLLKKKPLCVLTPKWKFYQETKKNLLFQIVFAIFQEH